ncbi:hypothetical protein AUR61_009560 [Stutzerimonas balearica]|uniref:FecR family protein n=1 Tax=Stutzerimonas balearica TaxID=74829 RepID=UPI000773BB42|nr:FecR domain-containing protein [Stutzerimonas balearica]OMG65223.1 hypothetical protein AUR61_009560 [Stutzerimonas balearica]
MLALYPSRAFGGLYLFFAALLAVSLAPASARADRDEALAAGQVVLAVGQVSQGNRTLKTGDSVFPGDRFTTGDDGYLYIRTRDDGFIILRPQTAATLTTYHIDPEDPGQSRFRIDLHRGVARSITGTAVKKARNNFRFNTPVAAIGVKGTDFTAYTDDHATRVVVLAGAVVASPFGARCQPGGIERCQGPGTLELSATQNGRVLQIDKVRGAQLLESSQASPDNTAPPREDEPRHDRRAPVINPDLGPAKSDASLTSERPLPPPPYAGPALQWGRWGELAQADEALDLEQAFATHAIASLNPYYILLRPRDSQWERPASRTLDFQLQDAQALIRHQADGSTYAAQVENGRLNMDFVTSRFTTSFDLLADGQRIPRNAEGQVFPDGTFQNVSQYLGNNNMRVDGLLRREGDNRAVYLFQSQLDEQRTAYGVTDWAAREVMLNRQK